jgi:undecaprenyl diphosphate synthase
LGIEEVSVYGFTKDNTKRPPQEVAMFKRAVVEMAHALHDRGAALLIVGDSQSKQFPEELKQFLTRTGSGLKINILANYGWDWDLDGLKEEGKLRSSEVSRIDLVVRWGGARRLSGFLPAQSVYADFYVIDDFWPQYKPEHIQRALDWFKRQDRTFGG